MIVYTQRYGYAIEFDWAITAFLNNLIENDEDKFEELKEKIREAYPNLNSIHSDTIELGHLELLPGDEADLEEGKDWTPPKDIKKIETTILQIIHAFAKELSIELPDAPEDVTANLKGPISTKVFTPQQYIERMTGECHTFEQENTVEEIHNLLIDYGEEIDRGEIKNYALNDVETLLANNSLVVLVDCAGMYGKDEMQQNYQWFEVGKHALKFV